MITATIRCHSRCVQSSPVQRTRAPLLTAFVLRLRFGICSQETKVQLELTEAQSAKAVAELREVDTRHRRVMLEQRDALERETAQLAEQVLFG